MQTIPGSFHSENIMPGCETWRQLLWSSISYGPKEHSNPLFFLGERENPNLRKGCREMWRKC